LQRFGVATPNNAIKYSDADQPHRLGRGVITVS
jgi:hypothetical protein